MPLTKPAPAADWFRADVVRAKPARVDREAGIIYGYSVMSKGLTSDSRGVVDDKTLDQVLAFGNGAKLGVKGRFGHPAMSSDALGTFVGRSKNFRKSEDGNRVLADLHLDKSAHNTPNGDLASYTMDLAESDPDAFGASVVVKRGPDEPQLDESGNPKKGEPGLLRFTALLASDVVDSPAANAGLFADTNVQFSAEMTQFLDRFLARGDAVERVVKFLGRYAAIGGTGAAINPENDNMPDTTNPTPAPETKLTGKTPEPPKTPTAAEQRAAFAAELKKYTDAFGSENGVKWFNEGLEFSAAQGKHIELLSAENKQLKERLSKAGVGEETPLAEGAGESTGKPEKTARQQYAEIKDPKARAKFYSEHKKELVGRE